MKVLMEDFTALKLLGLAGFHTSEVQKIIEDATLDGVTHAVKVWLVGDVVHARKWYRRTKVTPPPPVSEARNLPTRAEVLGFSTSLSGGENV